MSRPRSKHLRTEMKVSLPAAIVAEVDLLLEDPLTRRPKYASRSKLVAALLQGWLATMKGEPSPAVPSLEELQTL